ncbi:MAG: disulfide oxidoreductase [Planctomycetes bacterium]|nr:disulfide oxidoreductase [Planctomycetota bacterium]
MPDELRPLFSKEMTVGQALAAHPLAGQVFTAYRLGGCSHCAVSEAETLETVAQGYGIPLPQFLETLNGLPRFPQPAGKP